MVDRAKADYITVRRKQLDIEVNQGFSSEEKTGFLKEIELEKSAQFDSLKEEVRQFNLMIDTADSNFVKYPPRSPISDFLEQVPDPQERFQHAIGHEG